MRLFPSPWFFVQLQHESPGAAQSNSFHASLFLSTLVVELVVISVTMNPSTRGKKTT
jgi:hypothetical protein